MHAVRDRVHDVTGKHASRRFAVQQRNSVRVVRAEQREVRHVQLVARDRADAFEQRGALRAQHFLGELHLEPVVSGRQGRVRREHAAAPHRGQILFAGFASAGGLCVALQQRGDQQSRVALVHVIDVAPAPSAARTATPPMPRIASCASL